MLTPLLAVKQVVESDGKHYVIINEDLGHARVHGNAPGTNLQAPEEGPHSGDPGIRKGMIHGSAECISQGAPPGA